MHKSIWPFQFGSPKDIEQAEAKTTKGKTIRKRTEPAFIEPMRCKSVTALPGGEKWTFEIKFDGYRCIAVKRGREVTLFSRHKKVLNRCFPGGGAGPLDSDFVLDGELVALDSQGRPSFQMLQASPSQLPPIHFYAFDLLSGNAKLLVELPFSRRRDALENLLTAPKDPLRLSPLLQAPSRRSLRRCANSVWKASWANGTIPLTNPASDQARGSSAGQTWSRSSSSMATSRCCDCTKGQRAALAASVPRRGAPQGFGARARVRIVGAAP